MATKAVKTSVTARARSDIANLLSAAAESNAVDWGPAQSTARTVDLLVGLFPLCRGRNDKRPSRSHKGSLEADSRLSTRACMVIRFVPHERRPRALLFDTSSGGT